MNFDKSIHPGNQYHNQAIEHFHHLKKLSHVPPQPWLQAIVVLFSVAID